MNHSSMYMAWALGITGISRHNCCLEKPHISGGEAGYHTKAV